MAFIDECIVVNIAPLVFCHRLQQTLKRKQQKSEIILS